MFSTGLFSSSTNGSAQRGVEQRIARRLAGEEVSLPPAVVETLETDLDRLAGSYLLPCGERLEVRSAEGRLC